LTSGGPAADCLAGAVLAGGRSSRLGFDKAHLRLGSGRELVDDLIRKLRVVATDVLIAGGRPEEFGGRDARVVPDARPGAGALGGIYTAVESSACDWTLVVACDLPFLRVAVLRLLIDRRGDVDAVIPRLGGQPEPTHALYSRRCLPAMRASLDAGDLKVASFFPRVRVCWLEEDEVRAVDPDVISFVNVNSPDQLVAAMRLVETRGSRVLTE
jgi:molybdopterin-guanine dinucleotide biosynthesis protein A